MIHEFPLFFKNFIELRCIISFIVLKSQHLNFYFSILILIKQEPSLQLLL